MVTAREPDQQIIDEFVGAAHGDLARVGELVTAFPATVKATSSWNETPLGAAAHVANQEIVRFLLSKGVELDIFAASVLGLTDRVAAFLQTAPELADATGAHGILLLFHAAAAGHKDVCELLLSHGSNVNASASGNTALHGAALFGRSEIATLLLTHGADVNAKSHDGKTPLAAAVASGQTDIAELLRRHGGAE